MDTKRYIKLFNYGYLLAKHEPKILNSLLNTTKDAKEINDPLNAGKKQYSMEKLKGKLKEATKKQNIEKGKTKNKGRGK